VKKLPQNIFFTTRILAGSQLLKKCGCLKFLAHSAKFYGLTLRKIKTFSNSTYFGIIVKEACFSRGKKSIAFFTFSCSSKFPTLCKRTESKNVPKNRQVAKCLSSHQLGKFTTDTCNKAKTKIHG
jgi:hypothetical protein